jgi:hypothetical protein
MLSGLSSMPVTKMIGVWRVFVRDRRYFAVEAVHLSWHADVEKGSTANRGRVRARAPLPASFA